MHLGWEGLKICHCAVPLLVPLRRVRGGARRLFCKCGRTHDGERTPRWRRFLMEIYVELVL